MESKFDPRTSEQESAEALNRLMAHLHAFNECRKQLDHIEKMIHSYDNADDDNTNRALKLLDKAGENLDTALAIVVAVRLGELTDVPM